MENDAGAARAAALTGTYIAAFGASQPLAKEVSAWPAVFTVTGVMALASTIFGGRRKES